MQLASVPKLLTCSVWDFLVDRLTDSLMRSSVGSTEARVKPRLKATSHHTLRQNTTCSFASVVRTDREANRWNS